MADPEAESQPVKRGHSHHLHSRRLNKLFHPKSGKTFHVVHQPHEVDTKRRAVLADDPKATDFEVVIHGTEEHLKCVKDIHQHHTERRDNLYEEHGETLSKYDEIKNDLDAIGNELHMLTDHAVALDANFDKFGYSAHLRTMGDSETASLSSEHTSQRARQDDRSLTAIRFWKQPVIKQYLHKGLVWRSPNASEVASFELFIDLVYVAVIDTIGEAAVHHASAASFLHYCIVFAISWKIYGNISQIMNWFEIDDIFGRVSVLFILVCLYGFTTNVSYLFDGVYTQGIAFFIAVQVFTGLWWLWTAAMTPMVRGSLVFHAIAAFIGVALWIGSIHVEYPANLGLIFTAIFIDLFGAGIIMPIIGVSTWLKKMDGFRKRFMEYLPAVNIEHRVERTNAFTALVFGYSVITILFQSKAEMPLTAFLGKGMLGLIQAFIFNWIYFEIDGFGIHVHAIRRHYMSTFTWTTAHLPFSAGFILAASTLSELVIIHDSPNAKLEYLGEDYESSSLEELEDALRWFYCGGLGVALISMVIISLSHLHKKLDKPRLNKRPRLLIRTAVAIVIICLPLAHDLNSLQLIATTTSLVALVLILDLFGNSCSGDEFWTGGFCKERKRMTTYTANCKISRKRRQEMRKKLEAGESINLEDALKRSDSTTSMETQVEHGKDGYGAGAF